MVAIVKVEMRTKQKATKTMKRLRKLRSGSLLPLWTATLCREIHARDLNGTFREFGVLHSILTWRKKRLSRHLRLHWRRFRLLLTQMARLRLPRILPIRNRRADIRLLIRHRFQSLAPRCHLANRQMRKRNYDESIVARSRWMYPRQEVGMQPQPKRSWKERLP